jgi:hypothetical protein
MPVRYLWSLAVATILMVVSQIVQQYSYESPLAYGLSYLSLLASALMVAFAVIDTRDAGQKRLFGVALLSIALPFGVAWLLSITPIQPNVHGFAVLAFFFYVLTAFLCGLAFLIVEAVRAFKRKRI